MRCGIKKRAMPELDIIHADSEIVVVNKPGGLLAVPGRGPDKQDCVTARARALYPDMIDQPAVHRLDMATSGLMVLARTAAAHRFLSKEFSERRVEKIYIAILEGEVGGDEGEIRLAFRLDPANRPYQIHDPDRGKIGITRWRVLERGAGRTRIEFTPATGRTHQLRLHAAHALGLGCPIVGDSLYGHGRRGEPMYLHATRLAFIHPRHQDRVCFHCPPPF